MGRDRPLTIAIRRDARLERIISRELEPHVCSFINLNSNSSTRADVECLWVDMTTPIGEKELLNFPNLKYLVSPTTGLTHLSSKIDRNQIEVISLQGESHFLESITSTSELAWGLGLAVWRKMFPASREYFNDTSIRQSFASLQLRNLTIGLVGFGRIGKRLLTYASAFEMKTLYYDPYLSNETLNQNYPATRLENLEELCEKSDMLFVVASHRSEESMNYPILKSNHLERMKATSILINVSRGSLIDEIAVYDLIKSNRLAGIGLDVLAREENSLKKSEIDPLQELQNLGYNVIITPHLGGMCWDAYDSCQKFVAQKLKTFLTSQS
jgi:D-3-phosphoglycerate dehydrogenase / 2-oxoglutarate reductase